MKVRVVFNVTDDIRRGIRDRSKFDGKPASHADVRQFIVSEMGQILDELAHAWRNRGHEVPFDDTPR